MELSMGNLYDMNKQLVILNGKPLTHMELPNKQTMIAEWFRTNVSEYAMMLCHEERDYTIFHLRGFEITYNVAAREVIDCCKNRGEIYGIDYTENKDAIEIWIKKEDKMFCYYLFRYDDAVIECY